MSLAALVLLVGCRGGGEESTSPVDSPGTIETALDSVGHDTVVDDTDSAVDTVDTVDDSGEDTGDPPDPVVPRVILFIGDGMGFEHVAGGGLYAYGAEGTLTMEGLPYQGRIRTASLTGITDSAAAATVLATGNKTWNSVLGLDRDGLPVANLVEQAKALGMATGVVTRDTLTGATPSAFLVHQDSRYDPESIAAEEVLNLPDVLLGGGSMQLTPLLDTTAVHLVVNADELLAAVDDGPPLIGLFNDDTMPFAVDTYDGVPTLTEMTTTAIRFLEDDPEGFFLMVEGARIDHASHGNSTDRVHPETAAFDEAITAAIDWAATAEGAEGITILVTADHECGGMKVDPTDAVAGEIPKTSWRWNGHTNADVPVFAMGPTAEILDGERVDQLWVNAVLYAAINQAEVIEPEVPRLADGWFDDLSDVASVQTWDTSFGPAYNQLDGLRVTADDRGLWIGVDGIFQSENTSAFVLLDLDYGDGTGLGTDDLELSDIDGATDSALTALNIAPTLDGLGFDAVVSTINAEEVGFDKLSDNGGLRGLHDPYGNPADIWWLYAATNFDDGNVSRGDLASDAGATGATEGGWEIQIPWEELYTDGLPAEGLTVGVSVILTSTDGTYASNQVLPPLDEDVEPGVDDIPISGAVVLSVDSAGEAVGEAVEER